VPDIGSLRIDVGYGGAFAAFVDAAAVGCEIVPDQARALAELGERIRPHVAEQVEIAHPSAPDHLSFVVFVGPARDGADARHATVVSPGRLDRSPTGTATSARMAVLDARGELGERYVAESVLGTRFVGRVASRTRVGDRDAIVPAISGRAWITGFHQLVVDPADPLADGFKLPDTWGPGPADGLLNRAPRPPSR
jgi:proline racemase